MYILENIEMGWEKVNFKRKKESEEGEEWVEGGRVVIFVKSWLK
jgi:hypothetical protein